ncbi:MAG TPA: hypothetical protein VFK89_08900 [Actinomycetota bacterium]|nr:hypothetical protein [Actinomycetota bacterium]
MTKPQILAWAAVAALAVILGVASLLAPAHLPVKPLWHVGGFAALSAMTVTASLASSDGDGRTRAALIALAMVCFLALGFEVAQAYEYGGELELGDMGTNLLGCLLGGPIVMRARSGGNARPAANRPS